MKRSLSQSESGRAGFTLVELLVVIAIIAILAGIVIPNVPRFIAKARMARATSEVRGIELSLTKMLTDAGQQDFRGFFTVTADFGTFEEAAEAYSTAFYILLRKGKTAGVDASDGWPGGLALNDAVRRKLGTNYMDLAKDPWGTLYYIYPGPWRGLRTTDGTVVMERVPFMIYHTDGDVPGGPTFAENLGSRTVTDPETSETIDVGFIASSNEAAYIWSAGQNLRSNQMADDLGNWPSPDNGLDYICGGDDINSWDSEASWGGFYS